LLPRSTTVLRFLARILLAKAAKSSYNSRSYRIAHAVRWLRKGGAKEAKMFVPRIPQVR